MRAPRLRPPGPRGRSRAATPHRGRCRWREGRAFAPRGLGPSPLGIRAPQPVTHPCALSRSGRWGLRSLLPSLPVSLPPSAPQGTSAQSPKLQTLCKSQTATRPGSGSGRDGPQRRRRWPTRISNRPGKPMSKLPAGKSLPTPTPVPRAGVRPRLNSSPQPHDYAPSCGSDPTWSSKDPRSLTS